MVSVSAQEIIERIAGPTLDPELEGEVQSLVRYAIERGLCWEREPDVELLEVEIRMSGDASFYVLGDQDEVREAFLDEPDAYCEIDDVDVAVTPVAGEHSHATYEVVNGEIRRPMDGDEMKIDGGKVALTRERLRERLRAWIEHYAPLGRSAAIGRATIEIRTEIEGSGC